MKDVVTAALFFGFLFGCVVTSGVVCVLRDIRRWNEKRKEPRLGVAILNSLTWVPVDAIKDKPSERGHAESKEPAPAL